MQQSLDPRATDSHDSSLVKTLIKAFDLSPPYSRALPEKLRIVPVTGADIVRAYNLARHAIYTLRISGIEYVEGTVSPNGTPSLTGCTVVLVTAVASDETRRAINQAIADVERAGGTVKAVSVFKDEAPKYARFDAPVFAAD